MTTQLYIDIPTARSVIAGLHIIERFGGNLPMLKEAAGFFTTLAMATGDPRLIAKAGQLGEFMELLGAATARVAGEAGQLAEEILTSLESIIDADTSLAQLLDGHLPHN